MDAGLMTWYATIWTNVPAMSSCKSNIGQPNTVIKPASNESFIMNITQCKNGDETTGQVNYIEQVQVVINLTTTNRGQIEIYLHSPSNTRTQLLPVSVNGWLFKLTCYHYASHLETSQ